MQESDIQAVVDDIQAVVGKHTVERIALDPSQYKTQVRELLRTKAKELNALVHLRADDDAHQVLLRGTEENLVTAAALVREFLDKNYIGELEVCEEDMTALLTGGKSSKIVEFAKETGVNLSTDRERLFVVAKGEKEQVTHAINTVKQFLFGGEGKSLAKVPLESDELATIIGKGGKTKAELQKKFPALSIVAHRNVNAISLRGPTEDVESCRIEIQKLIASAWTTQSLENISSENVKTIESTRFHRRLMQTVNVRITMDESSIAIRGCKDDVRYAAALMQERIGKAFETGYYLESSLYQKVKESWRDPSYMARIEKASGAKIELDDQQSAILFSGKRPLVQKAKAEVLKFFEFAFGSLFFRLNLSETPAVLTPLGKSTCIPDSSAVSGAKVVLDRDMNAILIFSSDANRVRQAKELIQAKIEGEKQLVYVLELDASEDWLVSSLLGKNGKRIMSLRKETGCKIDVQSKERRLTISADTEDLVLQAKSTIDEIVSAARKECVFVSIPDQDMAAFVGKSGKNINELAAEHSVEITIMKKGQSVVRLCGKEEAVVAAKIAVTEWISSRDAKRREEQATESISLPRDQIPNVIGTKGSVIRSLEREFGCKVDVDRRSNIVTVKGVRRALALEKIRMIASNEKANEGDDGPKQKEVMVDESDAVDTKQAKNEAAVDKEEAVALQKVDETAVDVAVVEMPSEIKPEEEKVSPPINATTVVLQVSDFPSLTTAKDRKTTEDSDLSSSPKAVTLTGPTWASLVAPTNAKDTSISNTAASQSKKYVAMVSAEEWDCTSVASERDMEDEIEALAAAAK
jgi:transcription antitermination factor NusA-like protein